MATPAMAFDDGPGTWYTDVKEHVDADVDVDDDQSGELDSGLT